ncbi:hypothetical protein C8J56DRAFT_896514 [Mycena floridula]|nr:hypothetical protein C8J56DRAFT_896514 [Mycena floridula]
MSELPTPARLRNSQTVVTCWRPFFERFGSSLRSLAASKKGIHQPKELQGTALVQQKSADDMGYMTDMEGRTWARFRVGSPFAPDALEVVERNDASGNNNGIASTSRCNETATNNKGKNYAVKSRR